MAQFPSIKGKPRDPCDAPWPPGVETRVVHCKTHGAQIQHRQGTPPAAPLAVVGPWCHVRGEGRAICLN